MAMKQEMTIKCWLESLMGGDYLGDLNMDGRIMELRKTGCDYMNWNELDKDRAQC
jgi:hypothetical protein